MSERTFRGVAAAAGVAMGPVTVCRPETEARPQRTPGAPTAEMELFRRALTAVDQDLQELGVGAGQEAREILEAHRLMLADAALHELAEAAIAAGKAAEVAVAEAISHFAGMVEALDDPYLRERAADVRDLGRRLTAALTGRTAGLKLNRPSVVAARDLSPTDTIGIDRSLLLGIVTEQGGPTSHTSILARSWSIPAVVGASGILEQVRDGLVVALDGAAGEVVINPSPGTVRFYELRMRAEEDRAQSDRLEAGLPAQTLDGHRVELGANASAPADVERALALGAEGIGLFRSEFLFMGHSAAPDEEEQYKAYVEALTRAGGRRVIIRTLDIGGDKDLPYLGIPQEANPFLGCRALRLCFSRPDIFDTQLRALLRAGVYGQLAIMFPMVATLSDLRRAKSALEQARCSLEGEGVALSATPELGIMIEIPSAALIARHLAAEVDFFSIGSNDLVQYTLAVDRGNPDLASMYQPHHPAILQLIATVVQAAHAAGKWVGVCGEMASDPQSARLLVGLGVDELSVSARALPKVRRGLRTSRFARLKEAAAAALLAGTPEEVRALLSETDGDL